METDEERVRAVWVDPVNGLGEFNRNLYPAYMDDYAAIWAFTEAVIEEARQRREEIRQIDARMMRWQIESWVRYGSAESEWGMVVMTVKAYQRAFRACSRLEAAYAQHTRGIKPEALHD